MVSSSYKKFVSAQATWWRQHLPFASVIAILVVAGAAGAALRLPAQQQSGGSLTSPYALRCTVAGGSCAGKVGGEACADVENGVCVVVVDYDNCPGGPTGPTCRDKFGVVISCANPTQADADNDRRGDICDTCSDPSANGVITIATAAQWNSAGGGAQEQVNAVACTRDDAAIDFSRPCTDAPFSCGADRYCDANDQRCTNDRNHSCIRDQDCQNLNGTTGTCEQYCHANSWCGDADGGIKIEKSVMPTPYVWVPLPGYNDSGSDAVMRVRTDAPTTSPVPAGNFMQVYTGLVGDAPRSLAVDLEHDRVWVGNSIDNTISLIGYTDGAVPFYDVLQCPSGHDPRAIALDPTGNVFALGSGQYWTAAGWTDSSGSAIGRLYQHQADMAVCPAPQATVAGVRANASVVDSRGNMWVADRTGGVIRQIRLSDRQLVRSIPVSQACAPDFGPNASAAPYGITIDQFDNVWVTCWGAADIRAGATFGSCRANLDIPCRAGNTASVSADPYARYHDCAADNAANKFSPGGELYSIRDYDTTNAALNNECCTPGNPNCTGPRAPYISQSANRIVQVDTNTTKSCQADTDCYQNAPAGTCVANRCNHVVRGVEVPLASVPVVGGGASLKYCSTDERIQCVTNADCPSLPAAGSLPAKIGECVGAGVLSQPRGITVDLDNAIWFTDGNWLSPAQVAAGSVAPGIVQRLRPAVGQCNVTSRTCINAGAVGRDCDVDDQCRVADRFATGLVPINVSVDANNNVWVMNQFGGGPSPLNITNAPVFLDPNTRGSLTRFAPGGASAVTYPTGGTPLTLSDATGLQRGMVIRDGSWESVFDSSTVNTLWNRVAFDAKVYDPARQRIVIQLHASEQPSEFGTDTEVWDYEQTRSESGVITLSPLTLTGRFLHVKITLHSSVRNSSPFIGNLTLNFGRCNQAGPVESSCANQADDDNDGYVDCADFDCRGQKDHTGAMCCGNGAAPGSADNAACGGCSVCSGAVREDVAYTTRGANSVNDATYRCVAQPDAAEGNACTGPCTSCESGVCTPRSAGAQVECGIGCFACGGNGGGCTTIINDGADTTGPGMCQGANTCTNGVCAPPAEVCSVAGDEDGRNGADCQDSACHGQLGPNGAVCCSSASQCGNNGQCQACTNNVCVAVTAAEGDQCSGACTQCSSGACVVRPAGDAAECTVGACTAGTPGVCQVVAVGQPTLCINSDGVGGNDAYQIFESPTLGFGPRSIETPSTNSSQSAFDDSPRHISDEYNNNVIGNFFVFEAFDGDCNRGDCSQNRSRIEVKGATSTLEETYTYTWRFFISGSLRIFDDTFTHLHQIKADDCDPNDPEDCNSNPVIAITVDEREGPKMLHVENLNTGNNCDWRGGNNCETLELASAPMPADAWLDVEERVTFNQAGANNYQITIKNGSQTVLAVTTTTPLWRAGRYSMRPKWGIYRGDNTGGGFVAFANIGVTKGTTPSDDCRP